MILPSRVLAGALVLSGLFLASCSCSSTTTLSCGSAADCPAGQQCVSAQCRATNGDGGAIDAGHDAGAGGGHDSGVVDSGSPDAGKCGDGIVGTIETCDDGNSVAGDGCNGHCIKENGFLCPTPNMSCVPSSVCGDGRLGGPEACDDQNVASNDGCSSTCQLEIGWVCPTVGIACVSAGCGDGHIAGFEECDDHNMASMDGCSSTCQVEEGFACGVDGGCRATHCGDHVVEGTEQCDDANHDLGDGCDVFCHSEPKCTNGVCQAVCGDGVRLPGEACDDGNTRSGDGCSSSCAIEDGFMCTDSVPASQTAIPIPVVYRDFLPFGFDGGHPDFETGSGDDTGIITNMLGTDGKPIYTSAGSTPTTNGAAAFNQWYRDSPPTNRTEIDHLLVTRQDGGSYVFDEDNFFPLDGRGFQTDGTEPNRSGHNFSFTSELHYWFNFSGGEELRFRGDDDVFVFINKHLAVNLGGVHSAEDGQTVLDGPTATTLGLVDGGIYEAVVFQAERHESGSSYKLTLRGFNAPKSTCSWRCGDGIVTRYEACDDGHNDGRYSGCMPGCQARASYCGDMHTDVDAGEVCDDGVNAGGYGACAPGCTSIRKCGDGLLQLGSGEECDDGNTTPGDGCNATCHVEIN